MTEPKIRGIATTYILYRSTYRDEIRITPDEQTINDLLYHCSYASKIAKMKILMMRP